MAFSPIHLVQAETPEDYLQYHLKISQAEELIAEGSFYGAIQVYEEVFKSYPFVFLRDYKNATQIAWHLGDETKALEFVRLGITGGWEMKQIKKHNFLNGLAETAGFKTVKKQYDSLRAVYLDRINSDLRWEVRKMSWRDQWMAIKGLLRFSEKSQAKWGEKRFAPKNEERLRRLLDIINQYGYPGEKLIGNEVWMMGIVSRRNQFSAEFNQSDTVYQGLKPILYTSISKGEMLPAIFASIDDWYITIKSSWQTGSYGFLAELKPEDIPRSNKLREKIGLRSVEVHNALIDVQNQTGMWFNMWPSGGKKIGVDSGE